MIRAYYAVVLIFSIVNILLLYFDSDFGKKELY